MNAIPRACSVNQMCPSGPVVMSQGIFAAVNPSVSPPVNSCTTPPAFTNAIRPGSATSVNQTLPSGPAVIPKG
jgi:hypothetical protein